MASEPFPIPLPGAGLVVRWAQTLAQEIGQAPRTLRRARLLIFELGRLPGQIDELTAALDRTTATLDRSLPELSRVVAGGLNDRVEHLDSVVSGLNDTLTSLIGSIPGARRALRNSRD